MCRASQRGMPAAGHTWTDWHGGLQLWPQAQAPASAIHTPAANTTSLAAIEGPPRSVYIARGCREKCPAPWQPARLLSTAGWPQPAGAAGRPHCAGTSLSSAQPPMGTSEPLCRGEATALPASHALPDRPAQWDQACRIVIGARAPRRGYAHKQIHAPVRPQPINALPAAVARVAARARAGARAIGQASAGEALRENAIAACNE